jgi:hypothetical protein
MTVVFVFSRASAFNVRISCFVHGRIFLIFLAIRFSPINVESPPMVGQNIHFGGFPGVQFVQSRIRKWCRAESALAMAVDKLSGGEMSRMGNDVGLSRAMMATGRTTGCRHTAVVSIGKHGNES